MPRIAPQIKVDNCRELGAEVLLHGMSFDEAKDFAMNLARVFFSQKTYEFLFYALSRFKCVKMKTLIFQSIQ